MAYDVERKAGRFARSRADTEFRVALAFLVLVCASVVVGGIALLTATSTAVGALALLFVAYAGRHFFDARLSSGTSWGKGGNAEYAVGGDLDTLRAEGYIVMHDLDHVIPGNVDHFVSGPSGAFMIETKFRRYENSDVPKAKRVAAEIAAQLDAPWVQPVICCATRSYGPRIVNGVAVVGREQLLPYVRAQRNQIVPFDRVAKFADGQ